MKRFITRWLARWFGSDAAAPMDAASPAPVAMLDCESVMRQLWDYLDGELTPERMAALRAHLGMCQRCYPQFDFERSFLDAVAASAREHSNPDGLRRRLIEALREKGLSEG